MPVTVDNFKNYASWPIAGTAAVGLIVIARTDPASTNIIVIPQGTRFEVHKQGVTFQSLERAEIGESRSQIEILVQDIQTRTRGNIPANQAWYSYIKGVTISNPAAFSQGEDNITGGMTASLLANSVSDSNIQNQLDVSTSQVRDMLGLKDSEDLPANIRIDHAVYCLSLYYIEQTSSQRVNKEMKINEFATERRSHFPRDGQLAESIQRKVLNLIAPFRKNERFMPNVPGQMD